MSEYSSLVGKEQFFWKTTISQGLVVNNLTKRNLTSYLSIYFTKIDASDNIAQTKEI